MIAPSGNAIVLIPFQWFRSLSGLLLRNVRGREMIIIAAKRKKIPAQTREIARFVAVFIFLCRITIRRDSSHAASRIKAIGTA